MQDSNNIIEIAKYIDGRRAARPEGEPDEFLDKKRWILGELANLSRRDYEQLSSREKQTYEELLIHMLRILIFIDLLEIPAYKQVFDHRVKSNKEPELEAANTFKDVLQSISNY